MSQASEASPAVLGAWIPIALLVFVGTIANASGPRHALLVGVVLYALYLLATRRLTADALWRWCLPWCFVVLASAIWSWRPVTTLVDGVWEVFGPLAAGLLAAWIAPRIDSRRLIWPFIALTLACAIAVVGAANEHLGLGLTGPALLLKAYPGRGVGSTLGVLAMLIALWMLLAAPQRISQYSTRWRVTAVVLLLCGFALGLLGHNRMFWFALAAGLMPWTVRLAALSMRVRIFAVALFLCASLFGVLYSSVFMKIDGNISLERATAVLHEKYTADPRWTIWNAWADVIEERPWIGHGYGSRILPRVGEQKIAPDIEDAVHARHHAHNVFLNVLVQTGSIGLLAFATLLTGMIGELLRTYRNSPQTELRWAAVGATSLLLAALAKSLTDDFFWGPANIVMWTFMGILIGLFRTPRADNATGTPAQSVQEEAGHRGTGNP